MAWTVDLSQFPPEYLAENRSATLLGMSIAFVVLETVFVVLLHTSRYMARGERPNQWMEFFMTLTYLVIVGKIATVILIVKIGGAGRHLITVPGWEIANALKLSTVLQIVCPLTTSLAKISVLFLYRRVFEQQGRQYLRIVYATFALVVSMAIAQLIISMANCRPFSRNWNYEGPGTCTISGIALWRYMGIPSILTTLIIAAIPVPTLIKLHVSRGSKVGLAVVFGVGFLGIVAGIMRVVTFLQVHNFDDITYQNVAPLCWTIAEAGLYFIAGVLATLKPLMKQIVKDTKLQRWLSSNSRNSSERMLGRRWPQYRESKTPMAAVRAERKNSDASTEAFVLTSPRR